MDFLAMPVFVILNILLLCVTIVFTILVVKIIMTDSENLKYRFLKPMVTVLCVPAAILIAILYLVLWLPRYFMMAA